MKENDWILCSEKLPDPEVDVLLTVEVRRVGMKPYRKVVKAFHEDGNINDIESIYTWDLFDLVEDEKGNCMIPEGWFECVDYSGEFYGVDDLPIAWMKLPEAYKE